MLNDYTSTFWCFNAHSCAVGTDFLAVLITILLCYGAYSFFTRVFSAPNTEPFSLHLTSLRTTATTARSGGEGAETQTSAQDNSNTNACEERNDRAKQ